MLGGWRSKKKKNTEDCIRKFHTCLYHLKYSGGNRDCESVCLSVAASGQIVFRNNSRRLGPVEARISILGV